MSPTPGDSAIGDGSPFQSVDWDNRKVRHSFIRKVSPGGASAGVGGGTCWDGVWVLTPPSPFLQVYAIISLQLLVTVGIIAVFTFV